MLGRWGHDAALSAGVQLVVVNRPGYGGSTTSRTPSLLAVGRDTAGLAAHLRLDGYAVFGSSGGGPFAVATAIADPDGVRALGVVGGMGPWRLLDPPTSDPTERGYLALLDAGDVAGAWAAYHRRSEFEVGRRTLDDAVAWMFADEASSLFDDERYRAMWADDLRIVQRNLDGYVFDDLAWGGAWDVDLADVVAPSLVWSGEADVLCPPMYGQWYADRMAGSRLILFPGEGHFDVIDGHWPEVLAGLLGLWR